MKVIIYIAIFIILCPIFSCKENEPKNDSFFFYVPGSDIGITTSKRPGNLFFYYGDRMQNKGWLIHLFYT